MCSNIVLRYFSKFLDNYLNQFIIYRITYTYGILDYLPVIMIKVNTGICISST